MKELGFNPLRNHAEPHRLDRLFAGKQKAKDYLDAGTDVVLDVPFHAWAPELAEEADVLLWTTRRCKDWKASMRREFGARPEIYPAPLSRRLSDQQFYAGLFCANPTDFCASEDSLDAMYLANIDAFIDAPNCHQLPLEATDAHKWQVLATALGRDLDATRPWPHKNKRAG